MFQVERSAGIGFQIPIERLCYTPDHPDHICPLQRASLLITMFRQILSSFRSRSQAVFVRQNRRCIPPVPGGRPTRVSSSLFHSAAQSTEVTAALETEDVDTMDRLLRVVSE